MRRERVPSTNKAELEVPAWPQNPESPWLQRVQEKLSANTRSKVFLIRAIDAVLELAELSEDSLAAAAVAPNNFWVLLRALEAPDALRVLQAVDPLASAHLRGLEAKHRLVEQGGGALTAQKAAEALGLSRQAVDKRRLRGALLALSLGRRGYLYPAWQFTSSGTLNGLEDVLSALAEHDPWMQAAFFLNRNSRLENKTPLEMLRRGRPDEAVAAARLYGQHGAV